MTAYQDEYAANNMARLSQEVTAFIVKNPHIFGGADIYNFIVDNPRARAGLLAAVLTCLIGPDRRPAVRRFVIIVPPGSSEGCKAEARSAFVSAFQLVREREMESDEREWYEPRFHVVAATDRRTSSVLGLSKYPPAKPGALGFEPLKAAGRSIDVHFS